MAETATTFIHEFIRDPRRTGSVVASSRWLARRMVAALPGRRGAVVVELGPGTGAFTEAIRQRVADGGHHLAVEANARFAELLEGRFPGVDIAVGDAARLPRFLADRGLGQADAIVSGLPWSSFAAGTQRELLEAVASSLRDDGVFTTFTYIHAPLHPGARRFRRMLEDAFGQVSASSVEWRNLPPAFVYTARPAGVGAASHPGQRGGQR